MMSKKNKKDSQTSIQKLFEQLDENVRSLNNLFMRLPDTFISDFKSNALEISKTKDKEIRKQIDRVEQKLNEVSSALTNDIQAEPPKQDGVNENLMDVISEYSYIQGAIRLRSESKWSRDYTSGLNRIKASLKRFANAIDKYNEIAVSKNWQTIQSFNESQSIVKQRFESVMSEFDKEMGW